jgi:hypothetical protein
MDVVMQISQMKAADYFDDGFEKKLHQKWQPNFFRGSMGSSSRHGWLLKMET